MATIPQTTNQLFFNDQPTFKPWYSPKEMLELGVFGGSFFAMVSSRKNIPGVLFEGIDKSKWGQIVPADESINYYRIGAPRRNRQMATPVGIRLMHEQGWYQWYTEFFYGRRCEADIWRVREWKDEIETLSYYIQNGVLAPELEEQRWTNAVVITNTQFRIWKQHLLTYGWDPTRNPKDYGF